MINYYGKFVPNLSTLVHPLNALLKANLSWNWDQEWEETFKAAKQQLSSSPVLAPYNPKLPICLKGDSSSYRFGAILSHVLLDRTEHSVACASQTLKPSERNYNA